MKSFSIAIFVVLLFAQMGYGMFLRVKKTTFGEKKEPCICASMRTGDGNLGFSNQVVKLYFILKDGREEVVSSWKTKSDDGLWLIEHKVFYATNWEKGYLRKEIEEYRTKKQLEK